MLGGSCDPSTCHGGSRLSGRRVGTDSRTTRPHQTRNANKVNLPSIPPTFGNLGRQAATRELIVRMVVNRLLIVLLLFMLDSEARAAEAIMIDRQLKWRAECRVDEMTDERSCFIESRLIFAKRQWVDVKIITDFEDWITGKLSGSESLELKRINILYRTQVRPIQVSIQRVQ